MTHQEPPAIEPPGPASPLADLTLDQLKTLVRASRRPTVPDLSDEIWAALHDEHVRLASEWASGLAAGHFLFVGWEPLRPHARVIDLSNTPAGVLSPGSAIES
jgi:hypothetical protein